MDKYFDNKAPRLPGVIQDATVGRNKAIAPAVAHYLEHSMQVFLGIQSVIGLVEASELRSGDDEPQAPLLSPYDTSNLLGLVNTAAALMSAEAASIAEWANKYLAAGGC